MHGTAALDALVEQIERMNRNCDDEVGAARRVVVVRVVVVVVVGDGGGVFVVVVVVVGGGGRGGGGGGGGGGSGVVVVIVVVVTANHDDEADDDDDHLRQPRGSPAYQPTNHSIELPSTLHNHHHKLHHKQKVQKLDMRKMEARFPLLLKKPNMSRRLLHYGTVEASNPLNMVGRWNRKKVSGWVGGWVGVD